MSCQSQFHSLEWFDLCSTWIPEFMDTGRRRTDPRRSTTLDDAELFLQPLQLFHADVVAAAHHDDHGAQVWCQPAFSLQPFDDTAVDSCQSGTAGGLHQHLLIVCRGRRCQEIHLTAGPWAFWTSNVLVGRCSPTKRSTAFTASWSVTTSEKTVCSLTSLRVCADTLVRPSVVATL